MPEAYRRKDAGIETLRGLALLLMVTGHVIGSSSALGMQVPDDSLLRYLYDSLVYVRMPLFTAISGYVYALRPVTPESRLPSFLRGKCYRIGIPLVVVTCLFFVAQLTIMGTNSTPVPSDFRHIFFYGYAHFWFLQALLIIFLIIAIVDKADLTSRFPFFLGFLIASVAVNALLPMPITFFSFHRAVDLLPFFLLGMATCRFPGKFAIAKPKVLIPLAAALFVAVHQVHLLTPLNIPASGLKAFGLGLGLCTIYTLIAYRFEFTPLSFLGRYAYEVYLFHVFGTAGARILLNAVGIYDSLPVFTLGLAAGLMLPIGLKLLAQQHALFDLMLFGSNRMPIWPAKKPAGG